ncbi:MAG: phosphoribosylanthranilate isomerase, partial [Chloroflexota bacterium]|nr:phosphoribosylanthranilate isomerase [Chloroflexota bacterium]
IKAVHMAAGDDRSVEPQHHEGVEFLLLDTYVPGAAGGSGMTFDWTLAARMTGASRVMLAGGLTPENVGEAIQAVRPDAVDVSSGIEVDGAKDPDRMAAFVRAAREVRG